jgi:glycosyltransferase 2 family protein
LVRPLFGIAISVAFVVATLARVDFDLVGDAWGRVDLTILGLAATLSLVEVTVRGFRWVVLLRPLAHPRFAVALGYLSIGHLANAVLPARLGDVTRAYLAGGEFKASRVSVFGTIAVERIADAALLGVAAGAGILIGYTDLAPALVVLVLLGGALIVAALLVMLALDREAIGSTRIAGLIRVYAGRFAAGAASLKHPPSLAGVGALTVISFALAIAIMHTASVAVGLTLPVWQSALIVAAVTLSTAIPAGPASLGTYEFVGVSVMSWMGLPPEPSLLAVALVHAVATIVPASMGLVAMWAMGLRRIVPKPAIGVRGTNPRGVV